MKVNSNYPLNIYDVYKKQQQNSSVNEKKSKENEIKDSVQISPQAKKIKELLKMVQELPDIREEKVAELKEKIVNGDYNVPVEKIAAKMLENI